MSKEPLFLLVLLSWVFAASLPGASVSTVEQYPPRLRFPEETGELNIAVTPSYYDDMGSVLRSMGWSYTDISFKDLRSYEFLAQFDAVFINCNWLFVDPNDPGFDEVMTTGDPETQDRVNHEAASLASGVLEQYVRAGGTLYASDWAYEFFDLSMPGYLNFPDLASAGSLGMVQADVKDPGLAAVLGNSTVPISFDSNAWVPIQGVSDKAKVYLSWNDWQLAASFPYGDGKVIYTAFHNHQQTTDQEKKLLEYLVLLTTSGPMSADLEAGMAAAGHQGRQELLGTLSAGGMSVQYPLPNPSVSDLAVGLDWQIGTMRLTVFKPDGSTYTQQEGSAPLIIEIPDAEAGDWSFQVEALDVPFDNYPFVVQIDVPASEGGGSPVTPGGTAVRRTWLYAGMGFGLCLCGLLAALIVGAVILVRRRRLLR